MTRKKFAFLTASITLLVLLLSAAVFGQVAPKDNIFKYLSIFTEVFSLVRSNYVEPVGSEQLIEGAFTGVTDAIDEFSFYVPPSQMNEFRSRVEDETNRVGLIVTKRYGYAYVVSPLKGSLAEKAGLKPGDFIEMINDQPTHKMAIWQIRNLISKKSDKPLRMTILHSGMSKREKIEIPAAPFEAPLPRLKQHGSVAVVTVPYFGTGTTVAVRDLLEQVKKDGTKKLILDLRGNAAGSIEEAVSTADLLLRDGVITTLSGRRTSGKKWQADVATSFDGELQVLADHSTASGAELVAAAIRGNSRGKVVGVTTYGKAIEQKLVPLPSGGSLYVTIGYYTTPDGKLVKEQGVRPDVIVDLSPNFVRDNETPESERRKEEDLILKKALSLFGENLERAAA